MNLHQERVVLQGHIIDSLLLPKVLDLILMMGEPSTLRMCRSARHEKHRRVPAS